jgi:hypothetical protein
LQYAGFEQCMHVTVYGLDVAVYPTCHLTDRQRSCANHGTDQFPALRSHEPKQQLRRGETDANALLFASEGILRTPFHLFQRSYLQRHGLHLIASMFRRRSRNPPAVSQEQ